MRIALRIFLYWVFLPSLLKAQETLPIRNFTIQDYRAQQQNWSIGQSSDGLIYVGNSDGLLEYDGAEWNLYPFPTGLPVRSVFCDGNRIYVGGYGEFGYWENEKGQLRYHSVSAGCDFPSIATEEFWHILKKGESVYFQSFSRIYKLTETPDGLPQVSEITGPDNFMFLHDVHGKTVLQLIDQELYEIRNDQFQIIPHSDITRGTSVSALLPFGVNEMMIVTLKNGIYIWNREGIRKWNPVNAVRFEKDLVNKALRLHDGNYAFGTQLSGVYILSPEGKLLQHFDKSNGLQNNSVLGLYQDRQRHLWVALDKGIDLIPLTSPVSQYRSDEMPLEATYAVALWRNRLYAGTNRGVFWKPWPSRESFKPIQGLEGHVWELRIYDDQLLCGHGEGTFRISETGFEKLSSRPGGWTTLKTKLGTEEVLIQGTYTGLSIYRKRPNGEWYFSHVVDGVPPVPVKFIAQSANGSLWLAHAYKGLFRAKLSDDARKVSEWEEVTAPAELAQAYNVEVISWDDGPVIMVGRRYFRPGPDNRLRPADDLNDNSDFPSKIRRGMDGDIFHIYQDHVVLTTREGKTVTIPVGLIRNHETITGISDRYYLFCTHNGYYVYDREHPPAQDVSILPVLRKISDLHHPGKLLPIDEKIIVPASSRSVSLEYVMPVFDESVQYSFRLEGLQEEWSEWSKSRTALFSNLQPGNYTFRLRNSYNSQVLALDLEVMPFWYEAAWVRVLGAILFFVLLLTLYFWQEKRLERQREKLTREHEKELRQRELENQKRIIELENAKLESEINLKSQQLSNIAINVIRKNEILESIKNELIQVKNDLGQQLPNLHYQKLLDSINRNLSGKEDWVLFEDNFDEVHDEFYKRLKNLHPDITPGELRLAAALRMNLSSKEIAPILGISIRGVEIKRYRLRKKLGLREDINLNSYMMEV